MTRKQLIAKAKRLRAKGLSYRKIGEAVGFSRSLVQSWFNPEQAERKRERDRERYRNYPEYRERKRERERYRQRGRRNNFESRVRMCLANSRHHAKKYGYKPCITNPEIIVAAYDGTCHCCGVPESSLKKRLHMHHNHTTGKFEAWLCQKCNHLEGYYSSGGLLMANFLTKQLPTIKQPHLQKIQKLARQVRSKVRVK